MPAMSPAPFRPRPVSRRDSAGRLSNRLLLEALRRNLHVQSVLRQDRDRFKSIAESGVDWESLIAPDGRLLWVNDAVSLHAGFTPRQCMTMNDYPLCLVLVPDREKLRRALEHAMEAQSTGGMLRFRLRRDGQVRWMSAGWKPFFDRDGVFQGVRLSIRDTTDFKRAEEALEQANQRLQSLFDNAPVGVYRLDDNGRIIQANPELARLLGFADPESLVEYGQLPFEEIDDPSLTHRRMRRQDGSLVWVEHKDRPFLDQEEREIARIGFILDIHERKMLELQQQDTERILRHDLKSPIISCLAGVRLFQDEPNLTASQRNLLAEMEATALSLLRMVNLSASLQRMESGSYELPGDICDLWSVVRKACRDLEHVAKVRGVVFRLGFNGCAGEPCPVRGEEHLLYSLALNLLKNAVEASPNRGEVLVKLVKQPSPGLDIHNQGAVPPSIRKDFFEKYVTFGKPQGTGLGTYSARLIARAHNGQLVMIADDREDTTTLLLRLPKTENA